MGLYFQCELQQSSHRMTSWIEQRGAKVGARVDLGSDGWWEVMKVYETGMEESVLKNNERLNRNSLPSIR